MGWAHDVAYSAWGGPCGVVAVSGPGRAVVERLLAGGVTDATQGPEAEGATQSGQPLCMASQIAVVSRTPRVIAEAQCCIHCATPSGLPLR